MENNTGNNPEKDADHKTEQNAIQSPDNKSEEKTESSGTITFIVLLLLGVLGFFYLKNPASGVIDFQNLFHHDFYYSGKSTASGQEILKNAKNYLRKGPIYEDRYYESGYPDDNYGVCTDVVGFAMRYSGIDIMELLYRDEINNPGAYDVDVPDKCIDFRRVKNLQVYLNHTALSLTTDIYDTKEWQGGDIVVWPEHVGIISDRRNANGVPYVWHHTTHQSSYEEDILEQNSAVLGHYRLR